jgi:hypothetical protein
MATPLDDRIRELCTRVVAAENEAELNELIPQLRAAIREYVHNTGIRAAEVILRTFQFDKDAA